MDKTRECAICGMARQNKVYVMGNYICRGCQVLLDDPVNKAFDYPVRAKPMKKTVLLMGSKLT